LSLCENLVELAKDGNSIAFDQLIAQHQERVYALAYRILGNPEDAADIQQETFVRAWQHLRKFRHDASLSTWLHRIVVNLCLSMKRRKDYAVHEQWDEDIHTPGSGASACPERTEEVIALRRVLAAMPGHHRVLIVLRDMEGRSYDEIAGILGCSVESVRSRLCRARGILRERMRPYLEDNHEG
jgi:RNA polymerase sigma-70 factor, ECF subfamily